MDTQKLIAGGVIAFALLALALSALLEMQGKSGNAYLTAAAGAIGILVKSPLESSPAK